MAFLISAAMVLIIFGPLAVAFFLSGKPDLGMLFSLVTVAFIILGFYEDRRDKKTEAKRLEEANRKYDRGAN